MSAWVRAFFSKLKVFFWLFIFKIVNRTRPFVWKRPRRPAWTLKSPRRPLRMSNHWKLTLTSCGSVDWSNFWTIKMVKLVAIFRWCYWPKINFSVALLGQIYGLIKAVCTETNSTKWLQKSQTQEFLTSLTDQLNLFGPGGGRFCPPYYYCPPPLNFKT